MLKMNLLTTVELVVVNLNHIKLSADMQPICALCLYHNKQYNMYILLNKY